MCPVGTAAVVVNAGASAFTAGLLAEHCHEVYVAAVFAVFPGVCPVRTAAVLVLATALIA